MPSRLSIFAGARALLDLLLPQRCLLCGADTREAAVCAACEHDLPKLHPPGCPICAAPLATPAPACGQCLARPPAFDATFANWRYGFPLDSVVQALKFRRRLASADFLARGMLAGPHPEGDLLVPVPLSAARLRERGFNQAMEIARPLARALGLPCDAAHLKRRRDTPPQSRLPWQRRAANVRNAFECTADYSGRSIILVDDVMTSGATLEAIARVLKDHGAGRVTNWVAARTLKGGA